MITKDNLVSTPSSSGVYLFKENGIPIYIGKAINIKARLISHLRNAGLDPKEKLIIHSATTVETKLTLSEFEALLLEAKLIKQYEPKYNRVWKDGKSYPYIKITRKDRYPKIFLVRKENDGKSLYFGPFQSTRTARYLLSEIRRVFPFCTQKKLSKKRCFYAKIGLCNPCPNLIENLFYDKKTDAALKLQKAYKNSIKNIIMVLKGESGKIFDNLTRDLESCQRQERFEEAIFARNKLEHLKSLVYERRFGIDDSTDPQVTPVDLALAVSDFLAINFSLKKKKSKYRIESFDISNIFGKSATASLVVFINGNADKSQYRRFKIKSITKIGDTLMIQEVIARRFKKRGWPKPDILVIDGGKPQIRAVLSVLGRLGINIPLIGIAKNPDRIVIGKEAFQTINLLKNDPFFNLIRAIRDEAHRFAKKYHLLLRNKKILYN